MLNKVVQYDGSNTQSPYSGWHKIDQKRFDRIRNLIEWHLIENKFN